MAGLDLAPLPRTVRAGDAEDVEDVMRRLQAQGVGDGHPVIPPTDTRVELMLAGWRRDERLGSLAPLRREVTVEDVAVCAVMAGCPWDAMPVLVTAVRAIQQERFNLLGITTTTGSAAIGLVLHGAVVDKLGANPAGNCLGPGNVANATIGRALAWIVRVVGGAVPGSIDVAILGQPAKYGMCFADLPGEPGWPGVHEERGCPADPGAVTVLGFSGTIEVVDAASQDVEDLLETLAAALVLPLSTAHEGQTLGSGEPVAVLPPEWVMRLREHGWTKAQVRQRLWERTQVRLDRLPPSISARAGAEALQQGQFRIADGPDAFTLFVAGGPGTKATLLPLWSGSRSITVRLDASGSIR